MKILIKSLFFSLIFINSIGYANYCAVDTPVATVCDGFVIKSCSKYDILHIEVSGQKRAFMPCLENVTSYNAAKARCTVNLDRGLSVTGMLIDKVSLPNFFGRPVGGGPIQQISPDYFVFECVRR